jgi:hypothetical protein
MSSTPNKIVVFGDTAEVINCDSFEITETLPAKLWSVERNEQGGAFSLRALTEGFDTPDKLYGNLQAKVDRVWDAYSGLGGSKNLGVLARGIKGTGKSLLSNSICNRAVSEGVPVLVVNNRFEEESHVASFIAFISRLPGNFVVFLDEFGKTFPDDEFQNPFLSLLDGGVRTGCLFLLTANNEDRISDFLLNRPGRCRYLFEFNKLEDDTVKEYLEDNLKTSFDLVNETIVALKISQSCPAFSMDMLAAITEEANAFDEPLSSVIELMNIKPGVRGGGSVSHTVIYEGVEYDIEGSGYMTNYAKDDYSFSLPVKLSDTLKVEELTVRGRHLVGLDTDTSTTAYRFQTTVDGKDVTILRKPKDRYSTVDQMTWSNVLNK